jgi:phosphatidylglycerol:prolipoprotein diacylglycerol transferase
MDNFIIFGKTYPVYAVMGGIGVLTGIVYLFAVSRIKRRSFDDSLYVYVWAVVSALIGAKVLYLVVESGNIIRLIKEYPGEIKSIVFSYLAGGFVFYGGLLGALLGAILAIRYFGLTIKEELNMLAPVIPLVHGFGRLGCHIVGCCYGIPYSGAGAIIYHSSTFAPCETGLFPVQLTEAVFDFVIFGILLALILSDRAVDYLICIYLVSYAVMRFALEFFRGDSYRGGIGVLSTSQVISLLILFAVMSLYIYKKKVNDKRG